MPKSFKRKRQTVFQSGHYLLQYMSDRVSRHPCHSLMSSLCYLAVPIAGWWYLVIFNLYFLNGFWYWSSFHILLHPLYYLLQWNVCSCILPIFWLDSLLFTVEFWSFFIYSRYTSFFRCVVYKYFLPLCKFLLHPLKGSFIEQKF